MYDALSEAARQYVEQLTAEGVALTADDIVRLHEIGKEIESPRVRRLLARGVPVEIGGAHLWPLTLAGYDWFQRVGIGYRNQNVSLAYAMAHGREERLAIATLEDVKEWASKLRVTESEILFAVAEVIEQEKGIDVPERDHKSVAESTLVALMLSNCGGTPDYWERQVRIGYMGEVLAALSAQQQDGKPDENDPAIRATAAMLMACKEIREKWQSKD